MIAYENYIRALFEAHLQKSERCIDRLSRLE
jgi:hypothetical protein